MHDTDVERELGYTPCICAVLDGMWHPECYRGKTREQIAAGYKRAFAAARRHLKAGRVALANNTVQAARKGTT